MCYSRTFLFRLPQDVRRSEAVSDRGGLGEDSLRHHQQQQLQCKGVESHMYHTTYTIDNNNNNFNVREQLIYSEGGG